MIFSMIFCFNRFESDEILNDPRYLENVLGFGNHRLNGNNVEINVDFNVGDQNVRLQLNRNIQ